MPSKNNKRWTVMEERNMIRLRRQKDMTFDQIATEMKRTPESIKFRFEKLLMEHSDGLSDVSEVLRWFNLSEE
jgi:predicted ArsR family transcriptional regulator